MLAVVAKAIFEKQGKGLAVGDVWATDRYASKNPNLDALGSGGALYLVTVRPNDVLWLVAILRDPKVDAEGWKSAKNATPIRDVTNVLSKLKFTTGHGVHADKGKLGMSLQTPRQLTSDDVNILEAGAPIPSPIPTQPPTTSGTRVVVSETVRKWIDAKPYRVKRPRTFPTGEILGRIETMLDGTTGELAPLAKKVRAWLSDANARYTEKYDDETQVAAANVLGRFNDAPSILEEWAEGSGVTRALRLLLHERIVDVRHAYPNGDTLVAPASDPGGNAYGQQDALQSILPFVADFTEAQLDELHIMLAPEEKNLNAMSKLRFAILVRDQEAIDDIARRAAEEDTFAAALAAIVTAPMPIVLQATKDAAAVEAIIRKHTRQWQFGGGSALSRALVVLSPERAKAVLLEILPRVEAVATAGDFKIVMQVLECIDDADVATAIARRAHVKNLTQLAIDYFARHPHRMDALDAAAKEKGKIGTAAATAREWISRHASGAPPSAVTFAKDEDVPRTLLAPTWRAKNAAHDARDLPIPTEPATHLRSGELKEWLQPWHFQNVRDLDALRAFVASGATAMREQYLEGLMSIVGAESVPLVIELAAREPVHNVEMLMHVVSPRAMVAVATLLSKSSVAPRARAWLVEHADVAVKGLVPAATSKDAKLAAAARAGLACLATNGKRDAIDVEAKALGVPASELAADDALPAPGKLPPFADASALPAPILAKTNAPLSPKAVENLLAILSVAPKDATHPIVSEIKGACTQSSLDAFVWALVSDYVLAGGNARHDWALFAAGHLGGDDVARKIDLAARKWVQKNVELMQKSLDVLALIGSDVALSLCYERGLAAKFEDTQERARFILEHVAAQRGISYAELEDKLVPELGLDQGPLVLDYGARTFEVKLDERLVPFVVDGGARKDRPPKIAKGDDKEKAKSALERFETLAEDSSHVARTQLLRLERAMREARDWEADAWLAEIVKHPLLKYVAPRLVWHVGDGLVRVAEDGTLADASDAPVKIPSGARVRVAHPVDAPKAAWAAMSRVFADYATLQPFAQLSRETFGAPKDVKYTQMEHKKAAWSAVDELLTGRGWIRTPPENGTVRVLAFPLDRFGARGAEARLGIAPGLTIGRIKARPEQTLGALSIHGAEWSAIDRRIASELVRDAMTLAS